jgi:hypothetical protein
MKQRQVRVGAVLVALVGVMFFLWSAAEAQREPAANALAATPDRPAAGATGGEHHPTDSRRAESGVEAPLPPEPRSSTSDASTSEPADASVSEAHRAEELRTWLAANALAAEKNVERYCEQSRAVSKVKAFLPPTGRRDAAVFLAIRVDWGDDGRRGLLHLPDSLTTRMGTPPSNWLNFTPPDYAGLDFQWLTQLLDYDVWSLTGDGPIKDLDQATATAISPNWAMLQQWSKLRLVKGLREGDLEQATLEVNHLSALCASTGILMGEYYGMTMYGIERKVWLAAGRQPPESLPSVDEVSKSKQLARAGVNFLYPGVSEAVKKRALECGFSRCSSLTEAISASASMREALPETGRDLQWLLAQSPCDPGLAERLARGSPMSLAELAGTSAEPPQFDSWLGDAGL